MKNTDMGQQLRRGGDAKLQECTALPEVTLEIRQRTASEDRSYMSNKLPHITDVDPITDQNTEVLFAEREAASHEGVKELLAYWSARCLAGGFVMGRDVPSRTIAHLMKHLIVFEPIDDGLDFKYRLADMVLVERLGRDITGMLVSEVYADASAKNFIVSLRKTIATGKPVIHEAHVRGVLGDVRSAEAILLPMKSPDGTMTWVLNGVFYW